MPTLTEERPSTEERVSRIEGVPTHLAAKADVENCITRQIAESGARITQRIAESEARTTKQLVEVRAEIAKSEARRVRWMLTLCGIGIAAITIIHRLMG